jgi:2-polyprenyl-3-methyl-5-hydroxy-6-metoxy-1,4-benzoquinol methylase
MNRSWSDNEGVAALRGAADSLSALATAGVERRDLGEAPGTGGAELPIQDLPAHIHFARFWDERRETYLARRVHRACPLCNEDTPVHWFATQDGYEYAICDRCTMVYIPDVVPLDVWDAYFRELPDAGVRLRSQLEGTITATALDANRTRFGKYFGILRERGVTLGGARLLDVGTSTGGALKVAAEFGMRAFGVEGLVEAVEFCRARRPELQVALGHAEAFDASIFGGRFDIVTMWETLEHTVHPLRALAGAREALTPGGIVMVSLPNARNIQFSMLREYCFFAYGGYEGIGHVNLFTPDTLRRAFDTAGFELLHVETEFGTDWRQIAYYLQHRFDRIYCYRNLVRHSDFARNPEADLAVVLNWLSPAMTQLENALLGGPITIALAARR